MGDGRAELFDRAAHRYGSVGPDHFGYFAERLVERVEITPGSSVLDVATGTGVVLAAVARRQREARLVGVDLSTAMLARARHELRDLDVQLVAMDAQQLTLPPASFDVVLCSFGLQSFERPMDALAGLRRALRPGGQFGLVYPCGWHFLADDRWRWQVAVFRRFGADIGMTEVEPAEIERLLEQSGFQSIDARQVRYRLAFKDTEEWWEWSWSHGTRILFEAVPPGKIPALRRALEEGLRERCTDERGPIEGSLEALVVTARTPP